MKPATGKHGKAAWPLARRLMEKIVVEGGCWIWTGATASGYGTISYDNKNMPAHRAAYMEFVGELDPDLDVDHLCKRRLCIRPKHLEQVTRKVNVLRSSSFAAINAKKIACPKGHKYSGENLYITKLGHRKCRKCDAFHHRISKRRG